MVVLTPRWVGLGLALSHLLRSWWDTDITDELRLELVEFRAEITRAQTTLRQTNIVLEACTGYTGFLAWVIKLLAFSETLLLVWVIYLLIQRPGRAAHPVPASQSQTERSGTTSVVSSPGSSERSERSSSIRAGPTRPSDLRRLQLALKDGKRTST